MPDPLKVECPHCSGTLKLKDRSADGKKVRCPKCQEVFKIALPAEADELDVYDDFGGDDFGGDEELPAEEPPKKSKSGGKSSKKSKKRKSTVAIPWPLIGMVAGVLVLLSGLVFVVMKIASSEGSNRIDLTYILPDANMVMHLKVQEFLGSPLLASVMNQPATQKMLEQQAQQTGIAASQLVSVTIGTRSNETGSALDFTMGRSDPLAGAQPMPVGGQFPPGMPPPGQFPPGIPGGPPFPGAPGGAPMPGMPGSPGMPGASPASGNRTVTVVRTSVPIKPEEIAGGKMKTTPQTHNGKTYHKLSQGPLPGQGGDSLYFPESSVMVMAMEADIKEVIDQGQKQPRRREFDIINPGMSLLLAYANKAPNNPNAVLKSSAFQPQMQALERAANKTLRTGFLGLRISSQVDLEVVTDCADEAGAGEFKTAMDGLVGDWKTQFEKAKTILTLAGMNDVIGLGEKTLASLKVEQSGTRVSASGTIPSEIKEVAESISKKIPAMGGGMGGGSPGLGGPPGGPPAAGAGLNPSQFPPGTQPPNAAVPAAPAP